MNPEQYIITKAAEAVCALYGAQADEKSLQVQVTRKEFEGDYTLVVFPLLKISKASPQVTAYGFFLDLPDPLPRKVEFLPYLLKRHFLTPYSEEIFDYVPFPRCKR